MSEQAAAVDTTVADGAAAEVTPSNYVSRKELAKSVAELYDMPATAAERIITTIFEEIAEAVSLGSAVTIPGFGKFKPIVRAARTARNPQTGDAIEVPEKQSMKFKPALALKKALADV